MSEQNDDDQFEIEEKASDLADVLMKVYKFKKGTNLVIVVKAVQGADEDIIHVFEYDGDE
jgi:hypothetical protein